MKQLEFEFEKDPPTEVEQHVELCKAMGELWLKIMHPQIAFASPGEEEEILMVPTPDPPK